MKKADIFKKSDEILAENSSSTISAIKENTAKVEENTKAIKELHQSSKDRSESIMGFTGTIKRLDDLKEIAKQDKLIRKVEEVKSASLISNRLLKEIKEKKIPEPKEFPKKIAVEIEGAELLTIKGAKGEKGDKGEKGEKGDSIKGEKGDQGIQGIKGETGPKGDKGDKGENGINGIDGKDGRDGNDGSPDTPDEIIEKINSSKEYINPERIRGLRGIMKQVDDIGKFPRGAVASGVGDLSLKFFVDDLSSQLDGSTKTFTITQNRIILDVQSSSFPHAFRQTTDFTISGISRETITFTDQIDASITLASGQTLIVTGIRP